MAAPRYQLQFVPLPKTPKKPYVLPKIDRSKNWKHEFLNKRYYPARTLANAYKTKYNNYKYQKRLLLNRPSGGGFESVEKLRSFIPSYASIKYKYRNNRRKYQVNKLKSQFYARYKQRRGF